LASLAKIKTEGRLDGGGPAIFDPGSFEQTISV